MITYCLRWTDGNGRVDDDDKIIFDTENNDNRGCTACSFELKYNEPGSLEFTVLRTYPIDFDIINTTIALNMKYFDDEGTKRDEWWPFVGRVTSVSRDMYGNVSVTCEGAMAYLNNSIMYYYDHLFPTFNDFIQTGVNSYNETRHAIEPIGNWRYIGYNQGTHGSQGAFSFSKEYDKENKNNTYMKVLDGIKEHILDAYGGILHFIYYPNNLHGGSGDDYYIEFGYFDAIHIGFDYSTAYTTMPLNEYNAIVQLNYGYDIPCFGMNDNIINFTEESIKTGIWTAIMPIGEDGITNMGEAHAVDRNNAIRIENWVSYVGALDTIMKPIEFTEVKKEDADYGNTLLNKAKEYINRFSGYDYFRMKNNSIEGIEPCLVFPNINKIIKPLYPVIIERETRNGDKELVIYPCQSIRHNCFDAQSSQYTIGPIIPQNIINENISTWK